MTMDDSTNRWDDANGSAWNKKDGYVKETNKKE